MLIAHPILRRFKVQRLSITRMTSSLSSRSPPPKRLRTETTAEADTKVHRNVVTREEDDDGTSTPHQGLQHKPNLPQRQQEKKKKTNNNKHAKKIEQKYANALEASSEQVIAMEVEEMLGADVVDRWTKQGKQVHDRFEKFAHVTVTIEKLTAHGDGMAITEEKDWVVIVPFCLPGEVVTAKVYKNDRLHSYADLVKVEKAVPMRDESLVKCKYFGTCSGCQYQFIQYSDQLKIKQGVIERAYKNFAKEIDPSELPPIGPTIPSPLEYGYRTKLTPHFQAPPRQKKSSSTAEQGQPKKVEIGFHKKGTSSVMDIEECPLATACVNEGLVSERARVTSTISTFKRGATLLLRDSLVREEDGKKSSLSSSPSSVCITNAKETVRERVGDYLFEYTAGSFFQNNNSVLEPLTQYITGQILDCRKSLSLSTTTNNLVDAYCGAGLFAITLSKHFDKVAGIEISSESIECAKRNAALNNLTHVDFVSGDAHKIFQSIDFKGHESTVVIDPPRKGCDESFLNQLLQLQPSIVVYVSCNVHTQARDIGYILRNNTKNPSGKYVVSSIVGADLFPQTHHVESVAVLMYNNESVDNGT